MMREVFIVSDNIISPLGFTTEDNFYQLTHDKSGISQHHRAAFANEPFYASLLSEQQNKSLDNNDSSPEYSRFEKLLIRSITDAVKGSDVDPGSDETVIVISTTKGNISLLETQTYSPQLHDRIALYTSARLIAEYFKNPNPPVVVSNACISGLTALITAKRLIQSGRFKHAVVTGADVISKFVLSGFQSFQAVSDKPCKPFDKKRNGVTLGEAAGTAILSTDKNGTRAIKFESGAVSNDANHISGPSRTGEELCIAINKSLKQAQVHPEEVSFICAHGTATVYNDEMEAKAFSLANLRTVPVNSLKGFFGHTLGAAGLIESIISVRSLERGVIFPTAGYEEPGVSESINICSKAQPVQGDVILKTASGFGGCNAAVVFKKSYS